uniref:Uncharacterized protein n=1 Tax=Denticeps clupeoides TaxID=299321 RepID=A0AAY4AL31_9TELE
MDDELDKFLAEQKAKVAADKISLLQDPPYMEMRVRLDCRVKAKGPTSAKHLWEPL